MLVSKLREKGQGTIEYCLLLAFIAAIGLMLHTGGLKEALSLAFDGVHVALRGEQPYSQYYADWHKKSSEELKSSYIASDRLEADCKALALLADMFIGKSADGIHTLMQGYLNYYDNIDKTPKWISDSIDVNYALVDSEGWSEIMVPLSYKKNNMDDNGYFWLESRSNYNAVQVFAPDIDTYEKSQKDIKDTSGKTLVDSKTKIVMTDRIFYSDGMIVNGSDKASDRTIALKVHYDGTGSVDKVHIMAQKGMGEKASANWNNDKNKVSGLNLLVTNSGDGPKYENWK